MSLLLIHRRILLARMRLLPSLMIRSGPEVCIRQAIGKYYKLSGATLKILIDFIENVLYLERSELGVVS